jgi:hypothetical protein
MQEIMHRNSRKHENLMEWRSTNRQVLTDRPDIIIKNKTDKICLLIHLSIPPNRNIIEKEPEEKLKYKNLSVEIL